MQQMHSFFDIYKKQRQFIGQYVNRKIRKQKLELKNNKNTMRKIARNETEND